MNFFMAIVFQNGEMDGGEQISKFVAVGPKNYAYLKDSGKMDSRCKGISKTSRNEIKFEHYKKCVLDGQNKVQRTFQIASKLHNLTTVKTKKY